VPALKNLGKSNAQVSAARQLLDDVGRARQLAMSQRTTVYMVFVPTNFWNTAFGSGAKNTAWFNSLSAAAQAVVTNLCDNQLSGYTFVANGAVGDQPGRHVWHYLAPWQSLPEGSFIALQKFAASYTIADPISGVSYPVSVFNYTNNFPFPTETNTASTTVPPNSLPYLPFIAFNYLGQLTFDGVNAATREEYLPLAHGNIGYAINANKALILGTPNVLEVPPGNSTNIAYNIVDIDPLTGRATLQLHKIGP